MTPIDPTTLALLGRALDAAALRQLAGMQNLANASVPQARPLRIAFEDRLDAVRQALAAGQPVAAADIPRAAPLPAGAERIDLDAEMALLSRNAVQHQALLRALDKQLSIAALALLDGRR